METPDWKTMPMSARRAQAAHLWTREECDPARWATGSSKHLGPLAPSASARRQAVSPESEAAAHRGWESPEHSPHPGLAMLHQKDQAKTDDRTVRLSGIFPRCWD